MKYAIALSAILASGFTYWFASAEAPNETLALDVRPASLELGTRWVDTDLPWALELVNSGDERIDIVGIRSTCNCLILDDWTHTVAAGETGQVPMRINLGGSIQDESWEFSTPLFVDVHGESSPREYTLSGIVRRPFGATPGTIDFGHSLVVGRPAPAQTVELEGFTPLDRIDVEFDEAYGKAEIARVNDDRFQLTVTPSNQLSLGEHTFDVKLTAVLAETGESLPTLTIPCLGYAVSDLETVPARTSRGTVAVGETISEIVRLKSRTDTPLGEVRFETPEGVTCRPYGDRPHTYVVELPAKLGMQNAAVKFLAASDQPEHAMETIFTIDYFGVEGAHR